MLNWSVLECGKPQMSCFGNHIISIRITHDPIACIYERVLMSS